MRTLTLILIIAWQSSLAQTDFRNVKWGMTVDQVKESETGVLTKEGKIFKGLKEGKEYYGGHELIYNDVTVSGKNASLYYEFENGRLIQCRVVFRHGMYTDYNETISKVIPKFEELYQNLRKREFELMGPFQCGTYVGSPDYNNPDNEKLRKMQNWNVNPEMLDLIEKMVSEKKYESVFFHAKNSRSMCSVAFFTKHSQMQGVSPIVLTLYPSGDVKQKIIESDF